MNAKELHDLYAPLWELVSESEPDILRIVVNHPTPGQIGFYIDGPVGALPCSVKVAAALCRVAVEDWLSYKCTLSLVLRSDGWRAYQDCDDGQEPAHPTVHHALVAAAIAVAKDTKTKRGNP